MIKMTMATERKLTLLKMLMILLEIVRKRFSILQRLFFCSICIELGTFQFCTITNLYVDMKLFIEIYVCFRKLLGTNLYHILLHFTKSNVVLI